MEQRDSSKPSTSEQEEQREPSTSKPTKLKAHTEKDSRIKRLRRYMKETAHSISILIHGEACSRPGQASPGHQRDHWYVKFLSSARQASDVTFKQAG